MRLTIAFRRWLEIAGHHGAPIESHDDVRGAIINGTRTLRSMAISVEVIILSDLLF